MKIIPTQNEDDVNRLRRLVHNDDFVALLTQLDEEILPGLYRASIGMEITNRDWNAGRAAAVQEFLDTFKAVASGWVGTVAKVKRHG